MKETPAEPRIEKPKPPSAVPMWLGNPALDFFGTGPLPKSLTVIWDFKTGWTRGRLHNDPWGGSGWPGQPAIVGDRVYFGSADSYVYCLNRNDGSVIWKFKTTDSAKSSPCVVGDRLIIGNLDHTVYCLNTNDGSLVWKYQTDLKPTLRRRSSATACTLAAKIISITVSISMTVTSFSRLSLAVRSKAAPPSSTIAFTWTQRPAISCA